jgi:hypothetical protein
MILAECSRQAVAAVLFRHAATADRLQPTVAVAIAGASQLGVLSAGLNSGWFDVSGSDYLGPFLSLREFSHRIHAMIVNFQFKRSKSELKP